jgi:GNAT superfamily N-acetyltransferase
VETDLPTELRRYVFAGLTQGLLEIARSVSSPIELIKVCAPEAEVRAALPDHWRIVSRGYFMTLDSEETAAPNLTSGYRLEVSTAGAVTAARILWGDGELAASGYAAETDAAFVYDRIVTEPLHRRRGLAAALMKALGSARRGDQSRQVLVATEEGRPLYAALGWTLKSRYTTAAMDSI